MKVVLSLLVMFALCGCVLQSAAPNFSEAEGRPALGAKGGTYLPYSLDKGVWTTEDSPVAFVAVGQHYEFVEKNKTTAITFVPISGEWWIAQFREDKQPSVYVLMENLADAIYIHPLSCDALKKQTWSKVRVTFVKDDCFLATHTKAAAFEELIGNAGPRTMKLVLQK